MRSKRVKGLTIVRVLVKLIEFQRVEVELIQSRDRFHQSSLKPRVKVVGKVVQNLKNQKKFE